MSKIATLTHRGWIVSPVYDLLFFANVGWLLLLLPGLATSSDTVVDFWQIYFLTLPHRWITLLLVILDQDRRGGSTTKFWLIAGFFAALVLVAYVGTGAFICLALVDYLWNAWHFASQHAGVLRIYTRKVGGGNAWLERWGLRLFITYGAIRAAGWLTGWTEEFPDYLPYIHNLDLGLLALPVVLIGWNLVGFEVARLGKLIYLASVCLLYSGFILSLREQWVQGIVIFAAAGSMVHAVEYLAIVSHYAKQRTTQGSDGRFRQLARYWVLYLLGYMLALGTLGVWLSEPGSVWFTIWYGANLWAAFVHYAFDGIIWKLRKPDTAQALGIVSDGAKP